MLNPLRLACQLGLLTTARLTVSCLHLSRLPASPSVCHSVGPSPRSSVYSFVSECGRPKADALQRTSSRDIEFCVQQRKAHTKPAQNKCFFVGLRNGRRIRQRRAPSQSQRKKLNYMQASGSSLPPCSHPSSAATARPSASATPSASPSSSSLSSATNPPSYRRRKTTLIACRGVGAGAWQLQIW